MAYLQISYNTHRFASNYLLKLKQRGTALILMTFILALATTAYLLAAFSAENVKIRQDAKTYASLGAAKKALLAWAVSNPNNPGLMPYPDRNSDGNYDDTSDCYASNNYFSPYFTLGHLPLFKSDTNCATHDSEDSSGAHDITIKSGLAEDFRDGSGERLWYEVSSNLLHDYKYTAMRSNGTSPIINPSILVAPKLPWLVVRDRNGVIISNRVVAVIIAPGMPIGSQNRSGGIANANHYLDKIVMANGVTYRNDTYQDATNTIQNFIMGDDLRLVAKNDPTYKDQAIQPYYYNDKLVYITIDELMAELNNRAAKEAAALLIAYKAKTGQYPYAANLGASLNYNALLANTKGMLPIDVTDSCACASSQACSCSFKPINSVTFTKNSGTWATSTGACTVATSKCICSGAGGCTRGTTFFKCDGAGNCNTNQSSENLFTYALPNYADAKPDILANSGCSSVGGNIACSDVGAFTIGLKEAVWFKENSWQDYFYYEWSPTSSLQSGVKTALSAILVGVGVPIINLPFSAKASAQSRPSNILSDYLDSMENTDDNLIFDVPSKQKSNNYNDQSYIVAP